MWGAKSLQLCPALGNPMDCSPPGSSVHGISQTRILEWVAMPSSRSSRARDRTCIPHASCAGRWVPYHRRHLGSPKIPCAVHIVTQSCLTLFDPTDCSPPGSSVHGILQGRILEWVAMPSSRGVFPTQGSKSGPLHCRQILYQLSHQGSPLFGNVGLQSLLRSKQC